MIFRLSLVQAQQQQSHTSMLLVTDPVENKLRQHVQSTIMMMSLADTQGDVVIDSNNSGTSVVENNMILQLPVDPPRAALLQHIGMDAKLYWDRSHYSSPADQMKALEDSSTVYVGNLSFTIKSHHIHHHFTTLLSSSSSNGTSSFTIVKRIILGIDRHQMKPCGFCFVELYHRSDAIRAVCMISGTQLDGKIIRVELDAGFQPGRQLGRGVHGGQVRDDKRSGNQTQTQSKNENMKRYRSDDDRSIAAPKPVRLDEALPSTRNHHTNGNDSATDVPSFTIDPLVITPVEGDTQQNDNEDAMEDDQPRAKRIKRE